MLDKMYEMNLAYNKELSMYIIAGKLRLEELRKTELPKLQEKARQSGLPEDAQAANDFANMLGRFEKRLHDLELTRMISIQMAPQIRIIQNNDSLMAEKIQTSIGNTIPLWNPRWCWRFPCITQQAMSAQRGVQSYKRAAPPECRALRQGAVSTWPEKPSGALSTLKPQTHK